MFNLRGETSERVWKTYQELRKLTNDTLIGLKNSNKVITQEENAEDRKEQNTMKVCPDCGAPLVERSGISKKNKKPYRFIGCSNFPKCIYSEPFLDDDENLITFEQN